MHAGTDLTPRAGKRGDMSSSSIGWRAWEALPSWPTFLSDPLKHSVREMRDARCDAWDIDACEDEYLCSSVSYLCSAAGYVPAPRANVLAGLLDLAAGTLLMVAVVFAFACHIQLFQCRKFMARRRRRKAMARSLSCPGLVELKSSPALDACADMMAAFDTVESEAPKRFQSPTRIRRNQSLATLEEEGQRQEQATPSDVSTPPRASPGARMFASPLASAPLTTLVVLGAPSVGKSAVIQTLKSFAQRSGVTLNIFEQGLPQCAGWIQSNLPYLQHCVPLVVWDAVGSGYHASNRLSLAEYISFHIQALVHEVCGALRRNSAAYRCLEGADGGADDGQDKSVLEEEEGSPMAAESPAALESRLSRMFGTRKLVLCNKSDLQPCPCASERSRIRATSNERERESRATRGRRRCTEGPGGFDTRPPQAAGDCRSRRWHHFPCRLRSPRYQHARALEAGGDVRRATPRARENQGWRAGTQ